jgi:para-nitrobenzyl esterase
MRWQQAIAAFARSGNPSTPALRWTAVAPGTTQVMAIGQTQGNRPAVSTPDRLAAWRAYAASGRKLGLM